MKSSSVKVLPAMPEKTPSHPAGRRHGKLPEGLPVGGDQVSILHQEGALDPLPGHYRECVQKLLEHPGGEPPPLQQPRPPQQQGGGGYGGDDQRPVPPELLQKADVPLIQQHRQGLPDAGEEQAVHLLPAKGFEGAVRQNGEAVLAPHRLPAGREGDDLLAAELEQLRGAADLLHGKHGVEHDRGFFHRETSFSSSSRSTGRSPFSVNRYRVVHTWAKNFRSWDTLMTVPP